MSSAVQGQILLVEDNPRDAEMTMRAFNKRNLADRIVWVQDGAEALQHVFGSSETNTGQVVNRPKVILLDLKLPKVDGLEVLRELKSRPESRTIPIVVLTSSREEQDVVRSYELGVNSFVVKPLDFDGFSAAVAQLGMYWLLLNEAPPRTDPAKAKS